MARAADLTAAACTMDEPEGSPGYALHSARSARTLIMQIRTSVGGQIMREPTQIIQFGATPGGHLSDQVGDRIGGSVRGSYHRGIATECVDWAEA
jgi:hypothetical protein